MSQSRELVISSKKYTGASVVYVMSRDQRVGDNHALLAAQKKALELQLPLIVTFNLMGKIGVRAYEHVAFMLKGLEEVEKSLQKLHIPFILTANDTQVTQEETLASLDPAAVYFDFSPMKGARERVKSLAKALPGEVYVVDTHNIIPAWVASDKQEFAAHTFRRKVHAHLGAFLTAPSAVTKHPHTLQKLPKSFSFEEAWKYIDQYPKRNITVASKPGERAAREALDDFLQHRLKKYAHDRNNIAIDGQSQLSAYFHFGQLASLRVALEVLAQVDEEPLLFQQAKMASAGDTPSEADGMNALFEEMIVRKELSDNFCLYTDNPTSLKSAPEWAQKTLNDHTDDPREFVYDLKTLEKAGTHDEAWNAAQRELIFNGNIHGYMRMYWAKKILEWTNSPAEALQITIYLNDAYSIDGGDPNGYVGILWAIAGLHDRPWTQRAIFGTVRYLNYDGLRRKFSLDKYIQRAPQS